MKKTINRLKLLRDFLLRKSKVSGLPLELVIEATNKCNLNCVMCNRKQMTRKIGFMPFPLYKKIINETSDYLELVYLHGLGEPLFHPQIFEMIRYAREKNLPVGLSTNATLLTEERANKLLKSGLDYLIIALDAVTPEIYQKVRGGKNFPQVIKNVRGYLKLKNRAVKSPFTVLQFVKMEQNKNEAEKFMETWKGSGADVVRIKPVIDLLKENIDKNRSSKRPCFYIWRQLNLVTWDGKITTPCCMEPEGDYSLGDANKLSIAQIWNSPAMVSLRKSQNNGHWKKMPLCRNCNYPQPSSVGIIGAMLFPDMVVKKILPYIEKISLGKFHLYD